MRRRKVGIFLFHEVEVLDFAGPFEVFSLAEDGAGGGKAFEVRTVAGRAGLITARNGLKVQPDFTFADAPPFDILLIPGGYGAEEIEIRSPETIGWIQRSSRGAELTASICTGAFLLAEAGLLDGRQATTHWMDLDRLERDYPLVRVRRGVKVVDEGEIMTSGGISSGITMSLYILSRLLSEEVARTTAKRMEYPFDLGAILPQPPRPGK